jgi:beta-N-acetylhexosaminidase
VVDLTAKPFFLARAAIEWVNRTIDSMTLEEKVGQLFVNLNVSFEHDYLDHVLDRYHVGGIRFRGADAATIQAHIRYAQERSKVPLLVASNPEMGGFGSFDDGTLVATHLQAGSHPDPSIARDLGRVAGVETTAVGCNWAFAPIVDIHMNWRNTVVATRSFGNTADVVIERAGAYFDGISESGAACAIKHFPGDGVDERDQHVVTSWNTLGVEEWHATYGRVFRAMIDRGVQSVMAGHIGAPELSRALRPGIADRDIMPSSLAPELLQDLLRGELGFNGLIVTDASLMLGMTSAMARRDAVPAAIAAGCDMFLFFRRAEDDFGYMLDGVRRGVISEVRLREALERILGLKATLGLHTRSRDALVPGPSALAAVGSPEHRAIAAAVADKAVTLVKDTQGNLPLRPETHRRVRLYGITGSSDFTGTDPGGHLRIAQEELERAGFEVHVFRSGPERIASGEQGVNFHSMIQAEAAGDYAERYDAAIIFANVNGFAQNAAIRIHWSMPMAAEIPWYATEVPTIFVSLSLPNHLIDVPMVKTVIHAYSPTREAIRATVEKIQGKSPFTGTFNENVFCGAFDTRR